MSRSIHKVASDLDKALQAVFATYDQPGQDWERLEIREAVLQAVKDLQLTVSEFIEIDERPGRWFSGYPQWFFLLRRARNNGSLFDVLSEDAGNERL